MPERQQVLGPHFLQFLGDGFHVYYQRLWKPHQSGEEVRGISEGSGETCEQQGTIADRVAQASEEVGVLGSGRAFIRVHLVEQNGSKGMSPQAESAPDLRRSQLAVNRLRRCEHDHGW